MDPQNILENFYKCKHDSVREELLQVYYDQFKVYWKFKQQVYKDYLIEQEKMARDIKVKEVPDHFSTPERLQR